MELEAGEAVAGGEPDAVLAVDGGRGDVLAGEPAVLGDGAEDLAFGVGEQQAAAEGAEGEEIAVELMEGVERRFLEGGVGGEGVVFEAGGGHAEAALVGGQDVVRAATEDAAQVTFGKLIAPGDEVELFVLKTVEADVGDLDVQDAVDQVGAAEAGVGFPGAHALFGAPAHEAAGGAEVDAVGGGGDAPDVPELAILGGEFFEKGDELGVALGVGREVAEFALSADENGAFVVHGERAHGAGVGQGDAAPLDAVEFDEAFGISEVHDAARILQDGPVLRGGAVDLGRIFLEQELAGFRMQFAGVRREEAAKKHSRDGEGPVGTQVEMGHPETAVGQRKRSWRR